MNASAIEELQLVKQTRRHIATNRPSKEHICELFTTDKLLRIAFFLVAWLSKAKQTLSHAFNAACRRCFQPDRFQRRQWLLSRNFIWHGPDNNPRRTMNLPDMALSQRLSKQVSCFRRQLLTQPIACRSGELSHHQTSFNTAVSSGKRP
jgi:hypothetical protein